MELRFEPLPKCFSLIISSQDKRVFVKLSNLANVPIQKMLEDFPNKCNKIINITEYLILQSTKCCKVLNAIDYLMLQSTTWYKVLNVTKL